MFLGASCTVIFLHLSCWKFGTHILTPCYAVVKYAEIQAWKLPVHTVSFINAIRYFIYVTDNNLFSVLFQFGI